MPIQMGLTLLVRFTSILVPMVRCSIGKMGLLLMTDWDFLLIHPGM